MRRSARATRSTSSTKSTCCRRAAFNALLKTLEEPPPHVKFIFATTEIRKVPVTVLSRCQRFDLRRVDADVLVTHLGRHRRQGRRRGRAGGAGADRARRRRLGARCAVAARSGDRACGRAGARRGRAQHARACRPHPRDRPVRGADARRHRGGARANCASQYDTGADPVVVLSDLAEFTHFVTRVKIVPAMADDLSLGEAERTRGRALRRTRCRCGCCRAPGRCCSRASPRCRPPAGRSRPPKWCWCASPMPPTCRRRTR